MSSKAGGKPGRIIDRRRFLGRLGVGASAGVLSPLVPLMDREVGAQGYPLRFVVLANGSGNCDIASWRPPGTGNSFAIGALSDVMSHLQPFRDRMVVIEGLENRGADVLRKADGVKFGHTAGVFMSLTCAPPDVAGKADAAGISVDQLIAKTIKGNTPFPVLNLGTTPFGTHSYLGPGQPFPKMVDPADTFGKLFPSSFKPPASMNPADAAKALKEVQDRRRRILDYVAYDSSQARNLAGAAGWEKIDKYRTGLESAIKSLEDLESRLGSGTCTKPTLDFSPAAADWRDATTYVPRGELNQRLAAAALACDLTRVAVLHWGSGGGGGQVPEAGIVADVNGAFSYHQVAHYALNPVAGRPGHSEYPVVKRKLMKFYSRQLAAFLGHLQAVREGAGTLLDNTLVLWTNAMATGGHNHGAPQGIPNVLVVGKNVPIKLAGQYVKHTGVVQNQLLTSLAQAMGLRDVTTFGTPMYGNNGPLPGLV